MAPGHSDRTARRRRGALRVLWLVAGLAVSVSAQAQGAWSLFLEPASTRVGIAKVVLSVGDLSVRGGAIAGSYELKIPLAPFMNDRGSIVLDPVDPLDATLRRGGRFEGTGHSALDGRTHAISCTMLANGQVEITVDTGDRRLSFRSHLRRADVAKDS